MVQRADTGDLGETLREPLDTGLPKSCLVMGIHDTSHTAL